MELRSDPCYPENISFLATLINYKLFEWYFIYKAI